MGLYCLDSSCTYLYKHREHRGQTTFASGISHSATSCFVDKKVRYLSQAKVLQHCSRSPRYPRITYPLSYTKSFTTTPVPGSCPRASEVSCLRTCFQYVIEGNTDSEPPGSDSEMVEIEAAGLLDLVDIMFTCSASRRRRGWLLCCCRCCRCCRCRG